MGGVCSSQAAIASQHPGSAKQAESKAETIDVCSSSSVGERVADSGSQQQPEASSAQIGSGGQEDEEVDEDGNPIKARARDQKAREASLLRCFKSLDRDNSGMVDFKELKQYLFKTGTNISSIGERAEELMAKLDVNKDNLVSAEEFVNMVDALLCGLDDDDLDVWVAEVVFTASSRNAVGFGDTLGDALSTIHLTQGQMDKCKICFSALDRDGSGYVEIPELKSYLVQSGIYQDNQQEEDVQALMGKLDKNADGRVSEQEFLVTLSAIRRARKSDVQFDVLVDNVLRACQGQIVDRPALAEVILASGPDTPKAG